MVAVDTSAVQLLARGTVDVASSDVPRELHVANLVAMTLASLRSDAGSSAVSSILAASPSRAAALLHALLRQNAKHVGRQTAAANLYRALLDAHAHAQNPPSSRASGARPVQGGGIGTVAKFIMRLQATQYRSALVRAVAKAVRSVESKHVHSYAANDAVKFIAEDMEAVRTGAAPSSVEPYRFGADAQAADDVNTVNTAGYESMDTSGYDGETEDGTSAGEVVGAESLPWYHDWAYVI